MRIPAAHQPRVVHHHAHRLSVGTQLLQGQIHVCVAKIKRIANTFHAAVSQMQHESQRFGRARIAGNFGNPASQPTARALFRWVWVFFLLQWSWFGLAPVATFDQPLQSKKTDEASRCPAQLGEWAPCSLASHAHGSTCSACTSCSRRAPHSLWHPHLWFFCRNN